MYSPETLSSMIVLIPPSRLTLVGMTNDDTRLGTARARKADLNTSMIVLVSTGQRHFVVELFVHKRRVVNVLTWLWMFIPINGTLLSRLDHSSETEKCFLLSYISMTRPTRLSLTGSRHCLHLQIEAWKWRHQLNSM